MRPRVRFPGHVVASGSLVRRSPTIDGGDNRSVDLSWLKTRHGGQCWHGLGSRLCLIIDAAVLRCCCPRIAHGTDGTGSVSMCSAWLVYFECSRVATKCGLSSHDFFPRDITPPVIPVSLPNSIFSMWRVKFTTWHRKRLFSDRLLAIASDVHRRKSSAIPVLQFYLYQNKTAWRCAKSQKI